MAGGLTVDLEPSFGGSGDDGFGDLSYSALSATSEIEGIEGRVGLNLGYGQDVFDGLGFLHTAIRLGFAQGGSNTYGLAMDLDVGAGASFGLVSRHVPSGPDDRHGVELKGNLRW